MTTTPFLPVVGYIHPIGRFRPTKWLDTDEPLVKLSDALAPIAAAQAAQLKDAVPLSDEQIENEWKALQAGRLKRQNDDLEAQVGQPCLQCESGKLHIDSNGYNKFMRCKSCGRVPLLTRPLHTITASKGAEK